MDRDKTQPTPSPIRGWEGGRRSASQDQTCKWFSDLRWEESQPYRFGPLRVSLFSLELKRKLSVSLGGAPGVLVKASTAVLILVVPMES